MKIMHEGRRKCRNAAAAIVFDVDDVDNDDGEIDGSLCGSTYLGKFSLITELKKHFMRAMIT